MIKFAVILTKGAGTPIAENPLALYVDVTDALCLDYVTNLNTPLTAGGATVDAGMTLQAIVVQVNGPVQAGDLLQNPTSLWEVLPPEE